MNRAVYRAEVTRIVTSGEDMGVFVKIPDFAEEETEFGPCESPAYTLAQGDRCLVAQVGYEAEDFVVLTPMFDLYNEQPSEGGSGTVRQTYTFTNSALWTATHNLGFVPVVQLLDENDLLIGPTAVSIKVTASTVVVDYDGIPASGKVCIYG